MINKVNLSQTHALMEEIMNNGGEVIFTIMGNSMLPMLHHKRDRVCIKRSEKQILKKYDIPLFIRPDGKFVLHRIVKVNSDGYVIIGDNQAIKEHFVQHSQVVGVVKGFWRNEKYYSCDNLYYRIYVRIWSITYPFRFCVYKFKSLCKRFRAWRMK
ncbi:UNVERIFIED_CONTAM: hypothetical protein Cloal_2443 [Acetivibrio alkalicellulosi]